jgi:hypothetical protein
MAPAVSPLRNFRATRTVVRIRPAAHRTLVALSDRAMSTARKSRPNLTTRVRAARLRVAWPVLAATLLAGGIGGASIAHADEAATILQRCAHIGNGSIAPLAGFRPGAYAKALRTMPTVEREYTNCEELIREAELSPAGGGAGGGGAGPGGSGGGTILPPTPAEQQALSRAPHELPQPVRLGAATVRPGVVPVTISSAVSSLPPSVLALVALLVALALGCAARPLARIARARLAGAGAGR